MTTSSTRLTLASLVASAALAAPAAAAPPAPSSYLRLDGPAGSGAGRSVALAGDVNGDGHKDVVVGAPWAGHNGRERSGTAYVVLGGGPGTASLDSLGTAGFRIDGARAGGAAGSAVAGAGDVNGDGLDDLIVGEPGINEESAGTVARGRAYVVFGKRDTAPVDLRALGTAGFRIDGGLFRFSDFFGSSVAGAGDMNHDGRADVIIGATGNSGFEEEWTRGAAYVVYGSASTRTISARNPGRRGFRLVSRTGVRSVGGAGDVNADGRGDVIVGDTYGGHGRDFVVFGRRGRTGTMSLAHLGRDGFGIRAPRLDGIEAAVAGAGDVNHDGRDDVIVGASGRNHSGNVSTVGGGAYVVFGSRSTRLVDVADLGSRGFLIAGTANMRAGDAVAGAGFVNAGKLADVALLADGSPAVVYGARSRATVSLGAPASRGFTIDGAPLEPSTGGFEVHGGFQSIGSAADWDADGRADVIAGAPLAKHNGTASGSAYVFLTR